MTFWVRIEFDHDGQRIYDFVGPFDRYFADLIVADYAGGQEYLYGLTWHRVLSARIVAAEEAA